MYTIINRIKQFDFQINRVLTYGDAACSAAEIKQNLAEVSDFDQWYAVWNTMADAAAEKEEHLHAAYYYRMAEFFLKAGDERKTAASCKCIDAFYKGFAAAGITFEVHQIPFENGCMKCLRMTPENPKKTILVCGGYDSFIEEFVLQVTAFVDEGFDVILFEGPGQGDCIQQKLFFRYDFEVPVSAVINYFSLSECGMVGISWGGYFAIRAAAFEKRIKWTVAYDVCDDGYELMTEVFPFPVRQLVRKLFKSGKKEALEKVCSRLAQKSVLADWMLAQGKYITGTHSVYDMYASLKLHNLKDCADKLTQDILLLAGEKDHYIPLRQYYRSLNRYTHAQSVRYRLFTKKEGGEQHCQIGNHQLAIDEIIRFFNAV